jgi:hypothetical protein
MQFLGNRRAVISLLVTVLAVMIGSSQCLGQVNVTTWHNDNWRTGQNTSESVLNTSNVNSTKFGLLCKNTSIQGQIYPQPLVLGHNDGSMTVYVADEADYVYAFTIPAHWNGSCSTITSVSVNLLQNYPSEYPAQCQYIGAMLCQTISPTVGVLGTPVIDTNTGTLYLVAESQYQPNLNNPPTAWHHRLHALDTTTLAEKTQFNSPVEIPSVTMGGLNSYHSKKSSARACSGWTRE